MLSGIKDMLKNMENSTNNSGLKDKCQSQGELAIEEAKVVDITISICKNSDLPNRLNSISLSRP